MKGSTNLVHQGDMGGRYCLRHPREQSIFVTAVPYAGSSLTQEDVSLDDH